MDDHPGAGGRHKGVLKTQETLLPRDLDELIHCGGVAYIEIARQERLLRLEARPCGGPRRRVVIHDVTLRGIV